MIVNFPTPSAHIMNTGRDVTEALQVKDDDHAALIEVSSPKFFESYNAERKAATLRNEEPQPLKTHEVLIAERRLKYLTSCDDYEIKKERHREALKLEEQRIRKEVQPVVEVEERKVAESLVQIHASLRAIEQVKGKLAGRGFGHWGMPCRLDVDRVFKESVLDPGSDLNVVVRQAASLKYIKLPEGI